MLLDRKEVSTKMNIIPELRQRVFTHSSDFLERLANTWPNINAEFLACIGQRDFEGAFLNILTEEIHRNPPNYKVVTHVKLNTIPAFSNEEMVENILGMRLEEIRRKVCGSYADSACQKIKKCFGGEYWSGTEIDALIIRDKDFCFLEYETTRRSLCSDFMKMYWLQQLLNKRFESLFITKLTTVSQPEGPTTFESFNDYIDNIKTMLDKLLLHWSILEIVDLSGSRRRRRFHWRP